MTKNGRIRPLCPARNPLGKEEAKAEKSAESPAPAPAPAGPMGSGTDSAIGSSSTLREVNITADEIRNALIIEATPEIIR
ncbi:MAG: hypothetical protein R2860_07420 [Desulfobacterales bacterium]